MTDSVVGYGSLVAATGPGRLVRLTGVRRAWTVAMDNGLDLPGYKHYADRDGVRPAVCVAFLDLVEHEGGTVEGVRTPVGPERLAALDRRERQYHRVDVTARLAAADDTAVGDGRTWTYVGRADSRERAAVARRNGRLVVVRSYLDTVLAAFDALGPQHRARFEASTDAPGVPVVDLRRVDSG